MRLTPLVARMRPGRAMLHKAPAVTASTANPQFRVELLKRPRTEPAQATHRRVTQSRPDEALDQQPVSGASGLLDLMASEPLIEQITKRDIRPGRRGVLNLPTQPIAQHNRGVLSLGRTAEEQLPTGHRIIPARDPNLISTATLPDTRKIPSGPASYESCRRV